MKGLFSNGVKAVVIELLPEFERANGTTPTITWGSTATLVGEIGKGASGDLAILSDEAIDDLIRQGRIVAGSRVDLVRSAIGIAVRKGAPKPDIGSAAALKHALLSACTISYSKTGISGVYFPTVLERLGIAAQVASKTRSRAPESWSAISSRGAMPRSACSRSASFCQFPASRSSVPYHQRCRS